MWNSHENLKVLSFSLMPKRASPWCVITRSAKHELLDASGYDALCDTGFVIVALLHTDSEYPGCVSGYIDAVGSLVPPLAFAHHQFLVILKGIKLARIDAVKISRSGISSASKTVALLSLQAGKGGCPGFQFPESKFVSQR
ncbi:hypothetical protein HMPREF0574_0280 [Mobiluncus curtisii subsp. curtisii ATCC 35241]|nr:hypothetical protein [Mobiluncus curtisii]EFL94584.1 hypothetical protein HMPREF0574_0280 [Mobiluncus curtisii subsp. curtisii ATCC 35241]NMW45960.1 hypothetical protein [Mobiluncus curtisii]QQT13203.1 hypothetical protein I6I84_09010 [Mobiluncus curtisii]STY77153.1 Uncharacterised protein [Mobiluncus curtisii subsp. curtisii]